MIPASCFVCRATARGAVAPSPRFLLQVLAAPQTSTLPHRPSCSILLRMNLPSTSSKIPTRAHASGAGEAFGNGTEPSGHEASVTSPGSVRLGARVALRLANLLVLALPLGGLAFFGIFAAPAMFKVARAAGRAELAPQMVAVMLGRFGVVLITCSLVALLCWLLDKPRLSSLDARRAGLWWNLQGVASLVALGVSLYLHFGLMPRILAMQGQVLAATDPALRASFDVAHKGYSSAASVLLWASLFALGCLARRGARE